MKFFFFGLITTLLFLSCSNDQEFSSLETNNKIENFKVKARTNEIILLYEKIISEDDLVTQKAIVSSFDFETQASLFLLKFDDFKKNNNLNDEQTKFIDYIIEISTPNNLESVSKKTIEIIDLYNFLSSESIRLFGENEGWYLINRFENINQSIEKLKKNNNSSISLNNSLARSLSAGTDCNCTSDSNCKRLTGFSIGPGGLGLQWENGTCNNGGCDIKRYDFYFFIVESTDKGLCKY